MQSATHNQPEFTVSEISGAIKRTVEGNFSYVRVRGEISGLSRPASGHVYMSLKDDKSVIRTVCWKGVAARLPMQPENGLEVIVTGKVTTFGGSSQYQLVVDKMEVAGEGALMALLEKRKKELAAKGLFDQSKKQPIPMFPKTIGVVTSPTGAVIRDILHRLKERFPCNVLIYPVKVQGKGAEIEIAAAIRGFNEMETPPDLLIVARGGGSLEDLWCFNEEAVVYAVAECKIPLISAVGHETDTTLIDYVSDLRAPTPTGAAELATAWTLADTRHTINDHSNRIAQAVARMLDQKGQYLEGLRRGLPKLDEIVGNYAQSLDGWSERLQNALPTMISRWQEKLASLRLNPTLLTREVDSFEKNMQGLGQRMDLAFQNQLESKSQKLESTTKLFDSLNYKNVLKRGFAMVKTTDGKLISNTQDAQDEMVIEFADGEQKVNKS